MLDSETATATDIDLRAIRETTGESQETFARRFGVDQSTYSRWEKKIPARGAARSVIERVVGELRAKAPKPEAVAQ